MPSLSKLITVERIVIATAVGFVTAFAISWYLKKKKQKIPTDWEQVGVVKNLYIYPLKSAKGIELKTAVCTEVGVKVPETGNSHEFRDRSFVIYSEDDKQFQTARTIPTLVLIQISALDKNHITLTAPGMPSLTLKIPNPTENKTVIITMRYEEKMEILDCGDPVAKWITEFTPENGHALRIGYNDGKKSRNINQTHKKYKQVYPNLSNNAIGLHSDFSSYLLLNEASVKDLQQKIPDENISHHHFRPNILVEGAPAYTEDNWRWVRIGDVMFYIVRNCTRCILTTVNPETGAKSKTNEPLKTLQKYRLLKDIKGINLDGNRPLMGINLGYHSGEKINVGDVVYVGK